jgi:deoxyribose-phosphate aldolase
MSQDNKNPLSEQQVNAIVSRLVDRVRRELQLQAVPPADVIRGTWQDTTGLKGLVGAGAARIGTAGSVPAGASALAGYIDHTLLKPTATRAQIVKVCEEACAHSFASVCVNTTWIPLAADLLRGCSTKPIAVVGFPLGAMVSTAKASETRTAIADGAEEIDMVINIGALKSGEHDRVYDDIAGVVQAAAGRPVKVILETAMLSREEKIAGCAISRAAGAAFVKTSTGFGGGGATAEDVALMRAVVGPEIGVKASGGVRTAADARKMIAAGADRLGASASVAIVTGGTGKGGY